MSNCETFTLPDLHLEPHQVREALRAVLHTICFCRSLGPTLPLEVASELFDVTYVTCGDAAVATRLEAKITDFCNWIERHPGMPAHLCLSFYETRRRQGVMGWWASPEERMYWEQWGLTVRVVAPEASGAEGGLGTPLGVASRSPQRGRERQARLQEQVEDVIAAVVRTVNEKRDHIPAVTSSGASLSFPFDVSIAGDAKLFLGSLKRMLLQTTPPPVLN